MVPQGRSRSSSLYKQTPLSAASVRVSPGIFRFFVLTVGSTSRRELLKMEWAQKAKEILEKIKSYRNDTEGWKLAKKTVITR